MEPTSGLPPSASLRQTEGAPAVARLMPEYCTCGTHLVEKARFCHQCGRPTFEIEAAETPPPLPPPAQPSLQARLAQLPVGFANPIAFRIAFLMSLAIMMLTMIPGVNLLFAVWCLGAGWCAVLLYRRLTGLALSVPAGARLGSITGILTFASLAVLMALTVAFDGKQQFDEMLQKDPRMSQVLNDPVMLGASFLVALGIIFAVVVGICAAGGALGARFVARKAH